MRTRAAARVALQVSFAPATPWMVHAKLLMLLGASLVVCASLFGACVYVAQLASWSLFAFMLAECLLLCVRNVQALIRYAIHLIGLRQVSAAPVTCRAVASLGERIMSPLLCCHPGRSAPLAPPL